MGIFWEKGENSEFTRDVLTLTPNTVAAITV